MSEQALQILKSVFGYDAFRSHQQAIIDNIIKGNDTLAIMPTGGGKSICYQIPALIFPGLTLVISPLISLMEDQVDELTALGIPATLLNSTLNAAEYNQAVRNVHKGTVKLLYMAPETLMLDRTQQLLNTTNIDCLTIDEAHCISEWGHDFRPEYRQLADMRKRFPHAVCVALTATATPQVQQDIKQTLHMSDSNEFIASFNRNNLFLEVIEKKKPLTQMIQLIEKYPNQSGIIYCNSRKQVDQLAKILSDSHYSVAAYHAGLSHEERKANQSAFVRDNIQIMVATIAFGMGINKSNVRFVLHFDMPKNIESYYQQIGRAGRDGLPACCHFLFSYGDIQKVQFFINQKSPQEQRIANLHLNALIAFAESEECRRAPLLHYFGEDYVQENCGLCDNCISEKQPITDVTISAQKLLSCIYRTGQLFGSSYLIEILRGSKSKKIRERQHHQLPTYGIGTELSKPQWQQLSRKLLQNHIIVQDLEFGSLKLTENARAVLKGEQKVTIRLTQRIEKTKKSQASTNLSYNQALFDILRICRKNLADQENVPPYIIFSDKTLIEMSTYFPQSRESLINISGVGNVKLNQYGDAFLLEITNFCQQHTLAETIIPEINSNKISRSKSPTTARHIEIGLLFTQLKNLDQLQTTLNIKRKTLLDHLYKYQTEVAELPKTEVFLKKSRLSKQQQAKVIQAMESNGTERLRPIFETLQQQVSYDELHLLRLHYLTQNSSMSQGLTNQATQHTLTDSCN
ncbi:MAG: DNA helicase RecQ [Endozoicomonas sp. (ex Botrylloides leachii)]|nr:DNA helicase RecQ [Endozoicomonas sp. (ex Botrylloides leachii)]